MIFGVLMLVSLMFFRLPALYTHYSSMDDDSSGNLQTYNNAMLLVAISAIPLFAYSSFWSLSYMLFRKEFTASPGNYNAIHDPTINMVNTAVMVEGALDILSAATLMHLATLHLPSNVNNAILLFCLLELINGCQSFCLPVLLSGGYDNTPKDQVRWNAYLRVSRGLIDFGTIVLRIVLWVQFGAVSSVFLVKNMYNLLYTGTQVDRWLGVHYYPEVGEICVDSICCVVVLYNAMLCYVSKCSHSLLLNNTNNNNNNRARCSPGTSLPRTGTA